MESTCKINKVIERGVKQKFGQNISNKEKSALRNLIRAKNKSIVIKDTDKNMGAEEDKDKTDVISECERQMGDIKNLFENFGRIKAIHHRNTK